MSLKPLLEGAEKGCIAFHCEDIELNLPNEQALRCWLEAVAAAESAPVFELTYIFTSDEYLRQLNRQYLQHDYYTDVITFPYAPVGHIYGDVFISVDRVRDNAQQYRLPFEHELRRVMVHGLLHLVGYTDETEEQQALMRRKEDEYLQRYAPQEK